jgi:hypothetical protein
MLPRATKDQPSAIVLSYFASTQMYLCILCDDIHHTEINFGGRRVHDRMVVGFSTTHAISVFNTTFNTISVISWWSVLLVEETGVPGENHRPVASH